MSKKADELLAAALSLPETERAALVVAVLESIHGNDTEQTRESLARLDGLRAGTIDAVSHQDALRMIAE